MEHRDIVIGIAASGRTPYVLGGLAYAKEVGCHTVGISCNPGSAVGAAELAIEVVPGPRVPHRFHPSEARYLPSP